MSVNEKMTAIADKIRALLGITGAMGLDAMAAHLDTEKANVTAALAAIAEKGVTVDSGSTSDDLATLIAAIEAGGWGNDFSLPAGYDIELLTYTPAIASSSFLIKSGKNFKQENGNLTVFYMALTTNSSIGNVFATAGWYIYSPNGQSYNYGVYTNTNGKPAGTAASYHISLLGSGYYSAVAPGEYFLPGITYLVGAIGEVAA